MPCFAAVAAGGVEDNEKAYGELKFDCFSDCWLLDFVLCFLPELLGFVVGPFADKGGVGVDVAVDPIFPDPYLKNKIKFADETTHYCFPDGSNELLFPNCASLDLNQGCQWVFE